MWKQFIIPLIAVGGVTFAITMSCGRSSRRR